MEHGVYHEQEHARSMPCHSVAIGLEEQCCSCATVARSTQERPPGDRGSGTDAWMNKWSSPLAMAGHPSLRNHSKNWLIYPL